MKQISFAKKNNFIIRNKGIHHFSRDLELFKKHFPAHALNMELARANRFSYGNLDGQMLYFLLDEISPEEILENRKEQPTDSVAAPNPTDENPTPDAPPADDPDTKAPVDRSDELNELERRIDELANSTDCNESDIDQLRSDLENQDATIEDLTAKIEALEKKAFNKKKASTKNLNP
jgi:flagellar motor protein MotB